MTHAADSASTSTSSIQSPARVWIATLAAALAAALITWAAGESLMRDETGMGSKGGRVPISPVVYTTQNGMTSYGILGATLGLGLGLAGGLFRGAARSAAMAGLVGLVLGGAAGVAAAKGLVPYYFAHYSADSLVVPLVVHGGTWSAIGAAAGLAFGLGIGGPRRVLEAVIHAIVGALLATVTYEFAAIWLFPAAQTDRPLPVSSASRLFAYLVVALVVGTALVLGLSQKKPTTIATASTAS